MAMKKTLLLAVALMCSVATFAQTAPTGKRDKEAIKARREAHKAEIEAKRAAMKVKIGDHKADMAAKREAMKARIAVRKAELKAKPRVGADARVKVTRPKVGG